MERNDESYNLGKELAEKLANAANSYNNTDLIAGFVDGMNLQHRTLQQSVMKMIVGWMTHLAALPDNRYDARNEASVKLAKRVMSGDAAKDTYKDRATDTFLPMI